MRTDRPVILLVDDDDILREILALQLDDSGYEVLTAPDYRDALALIESARRLDLLLLDIVMPGRLDGLALARMASLKRPGLPVIHITGYDLGDAAEEARGPVLRKPIDQSALLTEISRSLAA